MGAAGRCSICTVRSVWIVCVCVCLPFCRDRRESERDTWAERQRPKKALPHSFSKHHLTFVCMNMCLQLVFHLVVKELNYMKIHPLEVFCAFRHSSISQAQLDLIILISTH